MQKNQGGYQAGEKWNVQDVQIVQPTKGLPQRDNYWVFKAHFKWFHSARLQLTTGSHEAVTQLWGKTPPPTYKDLGNAGQTAAINSFVQQVMKND